MRKHGHLLRFADELVQVQKPARRDPNAADVSGGQDDRVTLQENMNFLTPPADGGGSEGKTVNNSFEHANGLLSAITPYKSKFYLVDDQGGALLRLYLVVLPRRRFGVVADESDEEEKADGDWTMCWTCCCRTAV